MVGPAGARSTARNCGAPEAAATLGVAAAAEFVNPIVGSAFGSGEAGVATGFKSSEWRDDADGIRLGAAA